MDKSDKPLPPPKEAAKEKTSLTGNQYMSE